MSSHVMGDKSNVITCGIAVAPVTDWRYYGENFLKTLVLSHAISYE